MTTALMQTVTYLNTLEAEELQQMVTFCPMILKNFHLLAN